MQIVITILLAIKIIKNIKILTNINIKILNVTCIKTRWNYFFSFPSYVFPVIVLCCGLCLYGFTLLHLSRARFFCCYCWMFFMLLLFIVHLRLNTNSKLMFSWISTFLLLILRCNFVPCCDVRCLSFVYAWTNTNLIKYTRRYVILFCFASCISVWQMMMAEYTETCSAWQIL
jgi:hypothetical protein